MDRAILDEPRFSRYKYAIFVAVRHTPEKTITHTIFYARIVTPHRFLLATVGGKYKNLCTPSETGLYLRNLISLA